MFKILMGKKQNILTNTNLRYITIVKMSSVVCAYHYTMNMWVTNYSNKDKQKT